MSSEDKVVSPIDEAESSNGNLKSKPKVGKRTRPSPGKIKALKAGLEKAEQEKADLRDKLLRTAAEFENYKKRREAEYGQVMANANVDLLTKFLPILDDIERSIESARGSDDKQGLFEGMELIYKNFTKVLENQGVKPIEAVGQEFDPEKHEALMQIESQDHPSGIVIEEHTRGYEINDRVLRHSQVLVSK